MALQMIRSSCSLTKLSLARYSHSLANVFSHALKSSPIADQSELSNGIRVVTEKTDSLSTTVGVWLDSGSSHETEASNGITHFLEHLLFKGTENRSRGQLEKEVFELGGVLNSYTDRETSGYYITLGADDAAKGIELIADFIQDPSLSTDDIEATRKFVLNELEQIESDYEQVTMDYLHKVAFQQVPLGFSKYGPTANIQRFCPNGLTRAMDLMFKGPRMVVAASGNVDHNKIVQAVEKTMKGITDSYELNDVPGFPVNRYTGSDIRVRDDSMNCAHVALAIEGPGYNHPDSLLIGNWDLSHGGGSNVSSIIGMISSSDHLAQSFQSFNLKYKDTALFGSYFVGERLKLEELVWQLQYQWKRLCIQVANNELRQGKNILLTKKIKQRENSASNANNMALELLRYGRRIPLDEWEEKINRVNSEKLHNTAENYIWDRCPVVSAIGPVENLPLYENVRMGMSWTRY